jgi:hypothetical protein
MSLPRHQLEILESAAPAVPSCILGPGDYLTDGCFLFRVVGPVPGHGDGMVKLEDCYRLDVVRARLSDLARRRLRAVTPSGDSGRSRSGPFRGLPGAAIGPDGACGLHDPH